MKLIRTLQMPLIGGKNILSMALFVSTVLLGVTALQAAPELNIIVSQDESAEIARFNAGAKIFNNRNYELAPPPDILKGKPFICAPIDGFRVEVVSGGELLIVTPLEVPRANSIAKSLLASGFRLDEKIKPFQLFGQKPFEVVALYHKQVAPGDRLRLGKWSVILGVSKITLRKVVQTPWHENNGEKLYNNIVLPKMWPPENISVTDRNPMPVPYLESPPAVINIDVGRQLFVDEFLIDSTDLLHIYHLPEKYSGNPVLKAETPLEKREGLLGGTCRPCIWWHPGKQCFYLWYQAGTYFNGTIALATSTDGINWQRPELDVNPGTNQALPPGFIPDSYGIVPDWETSDPQQRFKLFATNPGAPQPATSFTSPDGVNWINKTATGPTDDRSSMFYNPFRKQWIYSLRSSFRNRSRNYRESSDFLEGAHWGTVDTVTVRWLASDSLDTPEPGYKHRTQLYNFDAVAYESVMLGFFELHRGPDNVRCEKMGLPKLNEISFGYSRDGFHFSRPDRRAHIPASRKDTWDRGFVESGGNICVISGDKLYFYYSGCQGNIDGIEQSKVNNFVSMYDPNAIGFATLRRDGFASLFAGASSGQITTRPIQFSGAHLFVNVDCSKGELCAEVLDEQGSVIAPYTLENSVPIAVDQTCIQMHWKGVDDLAALADKPVRLRFTLQRGHLYAFWVSRNADGRSGGYVAGGGPGYNGMRDE